MNEVNGHRKNRHPAWHDDFLSLFPRIQRLLRYKFHRLYPHEREEAIQNATVICLVAHARLHALGRARAANAWSLARYAALQHETGRIAGGHLNINDPMSRYARARRGLIATSLHTYDPQTSSWIDVVVEDKRARVHDVVAARLDIRAWFATLAPRTQRIATDLAIGCTTAETAEKYRISPGRVSQLRRELKSSWNKFQDEPASA